MVLLILLYVLASNGFVVAGWCWGLAWTAFGFTFLAALAETIAKNS